MKCCRDSIVNILWTPKACRSYRVSADGSNSWMNAGGCRVCDSGGGRGKWGRSVCSWRAWNLFEEIVMWPPQEEHRLIIKPRAECDKSEGLVGQGHCGLEDWKKELSVETWASRLNSWGGEYEWWASQRAPWWGARGHSSLEQDNTGSPPFSPDCWRWLPSLTKFWSYWALSVLSVCLSVYLSNVIYLSIHLPIYLSTV